MAYLNKEAYEGKREWAAKRMSENAEIETLTREQHEALEWLCTVRHNVHCNQEDFFNDEASNSSEYWDYINNVDGCGTIRDRLKAVELPDLVWSFSADDYMTDGICYELDYTEEEREQERENCLEMAEKFNSDIEKYLEKIDKEHGTSYCPSGSTRIMKVDSMKKYLRFGEVPPSGKSINFFKLSNKQNEDFTFDIEAGYIEDAFNDIPGCAYECGLSVFDIGADDMPTLSNLQLISSLLVRIDKPAYIVSGLEVGRGNDGEPLVKVESVEPFNIDKDALLKHILSVLRMNFQMQEYKDSQNSGSNKLFHFFAEYKINKITGEKVSRWVETRGEDWDILPGVDEYIFNGWTFSNPVNGFDVKLGMQGDVENGKNGTRIEPCKSKEKHGRDR